MVATQAVLNPDQAGKTANIRSSKQLHACSHVWATPDFPNTIRYSLNTRCQLMTPLIVTDLRLSLNNLKSVTMRGVISQQRRSYIVLCFDASYIEKQIKQPS
eukprot:scaffold252463_cov28-Prasinocladus_malaysianus.AAC.1